MNDLTNDEAYDLIIAVSTGELDEVSTISDRLRDSTADRTQAGSTRAKP